MPLYIREANDNDTEILAKDRLNFVKNSPFDFLYVCVENQEVLGFMAFRIRENIEAPTRYGEISAIVVNPKARNKGVGRFLMEYAEKLAKEHECIGT